MTTVLAVLPRLNSRNENEYLFSVQGSLPGGPLIQSSPENTLITSIRDHFGLEISPVAAITTIGETQYWLCSTFDDCFLPDTPYQWLTLSQIQTSSSIPQSIKTFFLENFV